MKPGPFLAAPFVLALIVLMIPLAICLLAVEWLWPELNESL